MKHLLLLISIIILIFISQVMLYLFPLYGLISTVVISALFLFFAVYDIYDLAAEEIFRIRKYPTSSFLTFFFASLADRPSSPNYLLFPAFTRFRIILFIPASPAEVVSYTFDHLASSYDPRWWHSGLILSIYSPHGTTPLLWGLLTILISGIGEAVYFQGLVQNATTLLTDNMLGVLFTVFLYGFFHITTHFNNLGLILLYMLLGSLIYMKWGNIYLAMAFYLSFQVLYFLITHSLFLS